MRRDDNPIRIDRDVTRPRSRPGQAWVCGYTDLGLGQCCRSGPTCEGRCGRTLEEDAGSVTANNATASSATSVDLPSCIPRRSLGARRQSLRMNLAILTAGLLMLCMTLPSREKIFVPGELSAKHAQILDNTIAAQRCGLCHPASHTGPGDKTEIPLLSGLLSSAQRLIENDGRQDQLCMKCHQGHMPAAGNRDPHDLSPAMWQQLQPAADTPWQLVSTSSASQPALGETQTPSDSAHMSKTSCAMCHNEHHGRGFDIKLISDNRCQACHQKQFESLASGHPEFKDFPVDRPRGVAFSHGAHSQNHFPKKNRDFDCKACHVVSPNDHASSNSADLVMRSISFEHACASCHDQPIRAATVDGWAAVQLPSIESEDIASDAALANWPSTARYGYDGVVSPVMRALLMADPQAVVALEKLPASGRIVELSSVGSLRSEVAKTLAIVTKRLIDETAQDGQAAWISRLQKVTRKHLDRELTEQDQSLIAAMAASLPPDLFRHVDSQWFGTVTPLAQHAPDVGRLIAASNRYVQTVPPTSSGDDLLVGPTSSDELLMPALSATQSADTKDVLQPSSDLLTEPNRVDSSADLLLGASEPDVKKPVAKLVKGATHLAGGGWYVDQSTLSIRYMPTGHADKILSAWAMWWSLMESHKSVLPSGEAERIARRLNLSSTSPSEQMRDLADWVPGNCAQCHQLETAAGKYSRATAHVHLSELFQVPERGAGLREFTKFQHTPHLTLPALNDCRYCHLDKHQQSVLPNSALSSHPLASHHPAMSEFATMNVSQCAACHRPGGANDRCVQCHNYHVNVLDGR